MSSRKVSFLLAPALFAPALLFSSPCQEPSGGGKVLPLREVVRLALDKGPDVTLARIEAAKGGDAVKEARSAMLPQVVAGTGLAYNNGFPLSIEGSAPSIIQAAVSQPIFSSKIRNLVREAEAGNAAKLTGPMIAANRAAANAALLYSELHQTRLLLPLLDQQLKQAETSRDRMEVRVQAGRARPVDLTMARLAFAGVRQQLLAAQARERAAEAALRDLAGLSGADPIRTESPRLPNDVLAQSLDALYQAALAEHPGIKEAEAQLRALEFHLKAEQAERHPQFALISQYALFSKANNYQDYFNRFSRHNYIVGLSIQVPVFTGFRGDARIAQSRRDVEAARLRLDRLKSDLRLSLERSIGEIQVAAGAAELARLEVDAWEESLKVSEALGEAGRTDAAQVDSARAQLLEKQIARVEADRVLFDKQIALLQSAGTLTSAF